jgi:hypothetical protein
LASLIKDDGLVFKGGGNMITRADLERAVAKGIITSPQLQAICELSAQGAIGLAIVGAGILWQRHEARISRSLRVFLPTQLRELVDTRATEA